MVRPYFFILLIILFPKGIGFIFYNSYRLFNFYPLNSIKHIESICYNSGNWSKAKKNFFCALQIDRLCVYYIRVIIMVAWLCVRFATLTIPQYKYRKLLLIGQVYQIRSLSRWNFLGYNCHVANTVIDMSLFRRVYYI